MSRIFWDTNLFVYLFEDYENLSKKTAALRRRMIERGDQLLTSTMTLGELLVQPVKHGDSELARLYEETVTRTTIVIPFDVKAARVYAGLRATRKKEVKPPDAIQLSCAASAGVDLFITNDDRLKDERVAGIHFVTSLERAPL